MIRVSNLHLPEVKYLAQEIKRELLLFNFTIQEIKHNLLGFNFTIQEIKHELLAFDFTIQEIKYELLVFDFTIQEIKHEPLAFDFTIPYRVPQSVGDSKKDIDQPYFWQAHAANKTRNANSPQAVPRGKNPIGKVHYGRALWKYYFFQAQNSTNQKKSFHLCHPINQ